MGNYWLLYNVFIGKEHRAGNRINIPKQHGNYTQYYEVGALMSILGFHAKPPFWEGQ